MMGWLLVLLFPLDESGVLEQLEHLFARNRLGDSVEHGHLLVGEPGLAGQSLSDLGILVLVVGPLGWVLSLLQCVVDYGGVGQRTGANILLGHFMDWGEFRQSLSGIRQRGSNVLSRSGSGKNGHGHDDELHL